MKRIAIKNPFNAPVYHEETVTSTMDISRQLAVNAEPHGTVIVADFQEAGRGRGLNRTWEMDRGANLPFTILLRFSKIENIAAALTLRAGLATALAIETFAPDLQGKVMIKWPNDIIIDEKKAAGILCEADSGNVHLGIGINVAQKEFPAYLRTKATSIAMTVDTEQTGRYFLLEEILKQLYYELETPEVTSWKTRLEQRLYKKGEPVVFIEGAAGSGKEVRGILSGIGERGELLIIPENETKPRVFITGEINFSKI
jgi:BirA family biotin operon repressor/biotin-[acetyl-CoA-carboxylase] ligase